ncbi:MAG: membrane protein insertion efficiency factor YidD [Desulfobacteraceae bacterium]|nr:MAG: membrane protein insertion efficiency factor YidD [Desulfobacteraceae bacterium]
MAKLILCAISFIVFSSCSPMVEFYRGPLDHLSAVRSTECPMYPSDSEYGRQSLEKHGFPMGWIMTVDRLLRCGRDEVRLSPKIIVDGKVKSYDPVEANDFWWYKKQITGQPFTSYRD